jgi:hypothetical protein
MFVMERKKMLKRTVLSVFCAAALLVTGAAYAQDSETLTLRSGEKVGGQLVDLGGVGYTVRVNGTERTIPQNDVAVIDFTGGLTDADWTNFTGTSKVVLRNGQTFDGSLYDIGGVSPLRLTIKTSNGEREMASNEVARILIARPETAAVATSGSTGVASTPAVAGAITVLANTPWTSTGVTVRKGQTVYLTTSGEVQLSDDVNDIANANGAKSGRMATNPQLRTVPAGALIGKIGPNGVPFGIGNQASIPAPAAGVLFLGVNDDAHGDNKGNYQVIVR